MALFILLLLNIRTLATTAKLSLGPSATGLVHMCRLQGRGNGVGRLCFRQSVLQVHVHGVKAALRQR